MAYGLFFKAYNNSNETNEVPRQCYATYKTHTFIFERSRTHRLVVRYEVIYYPNELPISAETCTQPNSELVAVNM